jgi:DNA-directed RNA polymerase specialized sigma subunit
MTAKEYLSQAYRIDQEVRAKLEQVQRTRDLATQVTMVLSTAPVSGTRNVHSAESAIATFIDLESEIRDGIERLMLLKREITAAIDGVDEPSQRMLLQLRYLNFLSWGAIATEMRYSKQHTFRLHSAALDAVSVPKVESK